MDDFSAGVSEVTGGKSTGEISQRPKALVVQTAFLGDVILLLPLIFELTKKCEVTLIVRRGLAELLKKIDSSLNIFEVNKGDGRSYRQLISKLQKDVFDYVFAPHQSFRTALLVKRIKSPKKIGYFNWQTFWAYHRCIKRKMELPEALRVLQLLEAVQEEWGVSKDVLHMINQGWFLNLPQDNGMLPRLGDRYRSLSAWGGGWQQRGSIVAMFPGSQWGSKRWPISHFRELAHRFIEKGWTVYWLGSAEDAKTLPEIANEKNNLLGKLSLAEVLELLKKVRMVISNDSGGGHLAALAGCFVVTLWGPTHVSFGYRPWGDWVMVIEKKDLNCRPCHHHGPKSCPLKHHRCLRDLSAEWVFTQLMSVPSLLSGEPGL